MFQNQCISVTDLRTNTKQCLKELEQPKYIFMNNRPIAVLVDIKQFEEEFSSTRLKKLPTKEITLKIKKAADKARRAKKINLTNI